MKLAERQAEISEHLETLERFWRAYPAMRLGQIVAHFARRVEPAHVGDRELCSELERVLASGDRSAANG